MKRAIKRADAHDGVRVLLAIECLRQARALLRAADCPRTLQRVAAALSSAKGAQRHVEHRLRRST